LRKFGLIGLPIAHSFSKKYFEDKFQTENISDCSYDLFELKSIAELPSLITSLRSLEGLNVTIPYKEQVIDYLDQMDADAKEIGAVNCIKIKEGKLEGFNTDVFGFAESLKKFLSVNPQQIFVLGTGGSSKAVCFVLKSLQLSFIKVSRQKKADCILYEQVEAYLKHRNLFINTTPLGMLPALNGLPPIPYERLTEKDFLFDLIYNPEETLFLKLGKSKGASTRNGLEMLKIQAEKSWKIWNSDLIF
jgi:shikimate dehydrogenase